MRILIVDDSADNRGLLAMLLRTRGHTVAGVRDGHEALAALEKATFDVIFMDEEMPGMGGIAATRAIHALSKKADFIGTRPLIVGVSGNCTEADEKRCLTAGMDAFLAKPISMHDLFKILDLLAHQSQPSALVKVDPPPASAPGGASSETLAAHLDRATGGNEKILRQLVKTFLDDAPEKLSAIRRAIAQTNAEALAAAAHSLKGSLGIVGAMYAAGIAGELQAIGRSGDLTRAAAEFRSLETEFNSARSELLALQSATPPRPKLPRKLAARSHRKR